MSVGGWSDLEIGDSLPPVEVYLSKEQVRAFARVSDMPAARFTDDDGARKEGLPGIITPGNMTMGLLQKRLVDHDGPVRLVRLGVTFRGLVLPDQALRVYANVVGVGAEPAARTIDLDVWIETTRGERLVTGMATVEVADAGQSPSA
jgi:acyl dehydratase